MELNLLIKEIKFRLFFLEVGSIRFTQREIDIISCILHFRAEKKIAKFLSISPRTVGTHVHNIMGKIGCHNKDQIVDFIEATRESYKFQSYYSCLVVNSYFEECLRDIGVVLARNKENNKKFYLERVSKVKREYLKYFEFHMSLLGLRATDNPHSEENIFSARLSDLNIKNRSYYQMMFEIIHRINSSNEVLAIERNFYEEYRKYQEATYPDYSRVSKFKDRSEKQFQEDLRIFKKVYLWVLAVVLTLTIAFFLYRDVPFLKESTIISDLPNFYGAVFLKRKNIDMQLKQRLQEGKGIDYVVLVGPGGAGKTMMARNYANSSSAGVKWIFPCSTKEGLLASFEQLAQELVRTKEDQTIVTQLLQINKSYRRDRKIVNFVKDRLRSHGKWLFIFDDVKSFGLIKDVFPFDADAWGKGEVIVTTRNKKFHTSSNLSADEIVDIEPLTFSEKLELFNMIVQNAIRRDEISKQLHRAFLRRIPPYPLDVFIAAHFVAEERISPERYVEYLKNNEEIFIQVQKNILSEITDYPHTRYDIVALSVQDILTAHPEYFDLMLVASMIKSDNIPIETLISLREEIVVREFLSELHKYYLIDKEVKDSKSIMTQFSIHKHTQRTMRAFLERNYDREEIESRLTEIVTSYRTYLSSLRHSNDYPNIRMILPYFEKFLFRLGKNSEIHLAEIYKVMADIYSILGNYELAESKIKFVVSSYEKEHGKTHRKTILSQAVLGAVYRNAAKYKEAEEVLEDAYQKITQYAKESVSEEIWIMTYLGSAYRNSGKYEKSCEMLEKATRKIIEFYGQDHILYHRCQFYLGITYKNMHEYEKAEEMIKSSYDFYLKHYGVNCLKTKRVKGRLASVYRSSGKLEKAKMLLEENLTYFDEKLGDDSTEVAWTLGQLGRLHYANGNYLKSKDFLERSMYIYDSRIENKDNIVFGWLKYNIARAIMELGELDKANELFEEAFRIYNDHLGVGHSKIAKIEKHIRKVKEMKDSKTSLKTM